MLSSSFLAAPSDDVGTSLFCAAGNVVASRLSPGIASIACSAGTLRLFHSSTDLVLFAVKLPKIKLIAKNATAKYVVAEVRKLPEPPQPNTVAEEPAPNDAPMSAPLPC